jgi:hypothetical protein
MVHLRSASCEVRMFFRRKAVGERSYLQIVESRRDGRSVRQHVLATLGRAEDWLGSGSLDRLLQSGARLTETALVLSALRDGDGLVVDSRRAADLRASVAGDRLSGDDRGTAGRAPVLVSGRAGDLRRCAAPSLHLRLRPGLRQVAGGLPGSMASICCTTCTGRLPAWVRSLPTRTGAPGRRRRSRT